MTRRSLPFFVTSALFCAAIASLQAFVMFTQAAEPPTATPEKEITDADRDHWAFLPLSKVEPLAVDHPEWNTNGVDRFLRAAMKAKSVEPLPQAGRATLIRRVTFDLTGLPPTPAQVADFVSDNSPDAYERLVDRLLASRAYGERYAQHWLDLARFAETDGFEHDLVRENAWRYRDWVIDALNRDLPFDEFTRQQIAGDELYPDDPSAAVATGFLLCGPDMPDINLVEERRHQVLNEMTSTVGAVFLAMQVGCAQCHDHKFDPVTQHDFYRLRTFFESAEIFKEHPIPTVAEAEARRLADAVWTKEDHQRERRRRELVDLGRKRCREKNPDEIPSAEEVLNELTADERTTHDELAAQLAGLPALPKLPVGRVMRPTKPKLGHLYARGDFRHPEAELNCGYPRVLARPEDNPPARSDRPRTELARWLTAPDRAIVVRAITNRVWQWHFGVGLSPTPSDFGQMGTAPDRPELLDWLARRFAADGYTFKKLHRLLVTSRAYKGASGPADSGWSTEQALGAQAVWKASAEKDPHNSFLWRRRRLRLEGEAIRDAMLASAERLSSRHGGPGVRPPLPPEVTVTLLKDQWRVTEDAEDHRRRSVYLFVRRNLRYPLFDVFDRPDTNASCPARHESTTGTQSLVLFNSEFSLDCARALAGLLTKDGTRPRSAQIREAYARVFSREPSADEIRLADQFLTRQADLLKHERREEDRPANWDADAAALADFCLALFNASEFVYVD
ncbi:MAG TPA: DUF1549 and DUF1553 domain-containing protein [Pirellulales bacterium]|jgi:hypothetical protein